MTAFDLDPSLRWLFCMTHPDDEISIGAFIRRLVNNGNEVFISWTHSTPTREAEGRAAAGLMGVPQDRLTFFTATDGSVCDEISQLLPSFAEMMDRIQPDRVCCGAFEQGHLDHDSTNYLVHRTFDGPVFEIPFYHTYISRLQRLNRFSDPEGEQTFELEPDDKEFKKRLARHYPSQNIWSILAWQETARRLKISKDNLLAEERMRLQTHFDYERPNHPNRLAQRVRSCPNWQRWMRAMSALDGDRLRVKD